MIVLAADYVGARVVEFLASKRAPVSAVVLHHSDPGGCNARIASAVQAAQLGELVADSRALDDAWLRRAGEQRPERGILAWWPRIIKSPLLELPRRGWLNFHPSFLPYNRGKNPNFWCLLEGTPHGVSLQYVDAGVDTGAVIAQRRMELGWEDTGQSVYQRSRELIVQLFEDNYDAIMADALPRIAQDEALATSHHSSELEAASRFELDAPTTARKLLNLLRARTFPPHPSATFEDGGERYAVSVSIKKLPRG